MSDWGSACGSWCGWCGGCTAGSDDVVERTCCECGATVIVGRSEPYLISVSCDRCRDKQSSDASVVVGVKPAKET